jgi:hypothetical protein
MTVAKRGSQVVHIPLDKITVINPRTRNRKTFETIVRNIGQLGLKRPITVMHKQGGSRDQYDLVCGQGRLATRDVIWDNRPTSIQGGADKLHFPPGVFSGAYTAVIRVPAEAHSDGRTRIVTACGTFGGGCPLSWFQANHPTWVIYKADQLTPAWQFGDTKWIPLDISNPDVQSWIQTNVYGPILSAGYQAISIDNVTDRNDFGEVGTCSIAPTANCTADGGMWTGLYRGDIHNDEKFIANRLAWAHSVTAWAHSRSRATMANVTDDAANKAATAALVNAFDIRYDEAGLRKRPTCSDIF